MSLVVKGLLSPFFNAGSSLSILLSSSAKRTTSTVKETNRVFLPNTAKQVHLVVLVHGWMGNPAELGYLQQSLEEHASAVQEELPDTYFLFVSANANDKKTSDGIAAGGSRLASEVNELIDDITKQQESSKISLSFVGNSLGGLYARYALSEIPTIQQSDAASNQAPRVQPKVFCTTATPHLGVSKHTYVPLPRMAEFVVANVLQPTGRDLFRYTDIIERMTLDSKFIDPLQSFQKRIAYANAYYTDFQVPTATAAFLSDTDSLHKLVEYFDDRFVELKVETPKQQQADGSSISSEDKPKSTAELAQRLDRLGWTKVFCDVRHGLPSVPIPFATSDDTASSDQKQFTSRELLKDLATFRLDRWHLPFGHTMMVANSKNDAYAKFNAAGQPIMDQLAADLIQDILQE